MYREGECIRTPVGYRFRFFLIEERDSLDLFRKMFMYPYLRVISMFAHNFLKIIFCRKLCYALLRGETDSR